MGSRGGVVGQRCGKAEAVAARRRWQTEHARLQGAVKIQTARIVAAVDEPIEAVRCTSHETGCMPGGERCLTHDLWEALGDHIHDFLAGVSLDDVVQRRLRTRKVEAA